MEMDIPTHPRGAKAHGHYMTNDDESVKIPAMMVKEEGFQAVYKAIKSYKWKDEDFLLATYPKNGTNFMWEIMTMLLRGTAEYIKDFKSLCMADLFPVTKLDEDNLFPSPRVLNTHYRLEGLPSEFGGKKTVLVIRNPKDVCVSYFNMESRLPWPKVGHVDGDIKSMSLDNYIKIFLYGKDVPFGNYFDYIDYMWNLRDLPNVHLVYYEDLILEPVETIKKLDDFMGTGRPLELIEQIADATSFDKMQKGKASQGHDNKALLSILRTDEATLQKTLKLMFRKGKIGDWKDTFTVADNELFDAFLDQWQTGKEIPFKYVAHK
ncbi:sulfotransferase 1C2A-like [Watersipora subatra]|uniref:sulfotransferase 1C2A-like n=1 Tax=Watersipora subatra TaxID=2589382 RepID=UPI00355BD0F1